jgi:hypothetical protein
MPRLGCGVHTADAHISDNITVPVHFSTVADRSNDQPAACQRQRARPVAATASKISATGMYPLKLRISTYGGIQITTEIVLPLIPTRLF